jgi:protocatechuate 3,4-dioxygenase alpha subunit
MKRKLQTPSQTIGPFFAYGLTPQQYSYDFNSWFDGDIRDSFDKEDTITIVGQVFDGNGESVEDAMIEVWQTDKSRQRFGRFGTGTDPENRFIFQVNKPEPVGEEAPFLSVIVFMRGALLHLHTRIYFSDEEERNAKDETLLSVPEDRRKTLIAQQQGSVYTFNIHMQGEQETVFFDV